MTAQYGLIFDVDGVIADSEAVNAEATIRVFEELLGIHGVISLIEQALENDEFTVGIATSSTREKSGAILESAQIPIEQMVYVTGSDVTHKKPHPELFLTACRKLGQPPSACLVIEDAPNGVEAAHAAGCKCIAVTNSVDADKLTDADLVADSLEEVTLQMVEGLLHHDITPPKP